MDYVRITQVDKMRAKASECSRNWSQYFVAGVTILLSLTVFLLLVAETMPPTSDAVPLIGTSSVNYTLVLLIVSWHL